jgi:hypothetical protein
LAWLMRDMLKDVGRFHTVLKSVHELDNELVLPVIKSLFSPSEREQCFIAAYYRTVANVRTLLTFSDASHFQAIAMLARAMFELDVDVRLIAHDVDAIDKIYAFRDYERLRTARDVVALAGAGKTTDDVSIQKSFIAANETPIDAHCQKLWPKTKRPPHWSLMGLRDRAKRLGAPFEETYETMYAQLSWDVHPGVAGVLNLDENAFPVKCGLALKVAFDSYADLLRAVAQELKIDKGVEKLADKIEVALALPFTENDAQIAALFRTIAP